ncbi:MAG: class B sortase [Defluviitaleaceae bacterium]|nr:class B sortase [Defluviitaleaceae bacterium]MCL2262831.1 class B sortase [Defluviitaleaceae bacterium]
MFNKLRQKRQGLILCLAVIATLCAVVLAFFVVPRVWDLQAIRREMAELPNLSPFDAYWQKSNPHYVGWLQIDGTNIDFPVVRGTDNVRYLTTTFRGEENMVGAIFMDYRNTDLSAPHIIIYGHEARTETGESLMFGCLYRFTNAAHKAAHPTITFFENDTMHEFQIFAARRTDIFDPAYQLDFSGSGAFAAFLERIGKHGTSPTQIITLSTCIGTNNDLRMIVQGALIRSIPIITEQDEAGDWTISLQK